MRNSLRPSSCSDEKPHHRVITKTLTHGEVVFQTRHAGTGTSLGHAGYQAFTDQDLNKRQLEELEVKKFFGL